MPLNQIRATKEVSVTKRSRESLLSRRAGHVRASFSMNRCQTGKLGGSPWASSGHTPGLSPPQAGLPNLASLRSPQLPLLHRSAAPTHHGHHEGDTFSKLFPHNGHTRRLLNGHAPRISFPPAPTTRLGVPLPHNHPQSARDTPQSQPP